MKKIRLLNILVCGLLLSGITLGEGVSNVIERATLSSRTHRTWEGVYKFSGESTLKMWGLKDLHVLKYRTSGSEGDLVEFTNENAKDTLQLLREVNTNVKGVTPVLEGIDALPNDDGAKIIVRWRHPGQGALRMVEEYHYTANGLMLVSRSHLMEIDGERQWISDTALERREMELKKLYPAVRKDIQKTEQK